MNINYLKNIRKLIRDLPRYKSIGPSSAIKQLKQEGYYVVENLVNRNTCNQLVNILDNIIKENNPNVWHDENYSDHRLFGIDKKNRLYQKFIFSDVDAPARNYLTPKDGYIMTNKVVFKDNNKGSGGGWHRDSYLYPQVKLIVYLNDVDETNGAFEYIRKSHRLGRKLQDVVWGRYNKNSKPSRFNDEIINKYYRDESVVLKGKAGTGIFVDTSGLHRGMPLQQGVRYAFTNYYFTNDIPQKMREKFI